MFVEVFPTLLHQGGENFHKHAKQNAQGWVITHATKGGQLLMCRRVGKMFLKRATGVQRNFTDAKLCHVYILKANGILLLNIS